MPELITLYHPDNGEPRTFDLEKTSMQMYGDAGWVDNPAKIGRNVWGPKSQPEVDRIRSLFLSGGISGIGDSIPVNAESVDAIDKAMKENLALKEKIRAMESKKELAQEKAHKKNEAAKKLAGELPKESVQVPLAPNISIKRKAKGLKAQDETGSSDL